MSGVAQLPSYAPNAHGVGQVHLGMGAFHRSHQALMTDEALAHHGGDWRITGVSLRSKEQAAQLNAQNGLYTLLVRSSGATTARVVASIKDVIAADTKATLAALVNPAIRVVTLTVTEAGYGIDTKSRLPDQSNDVVAADLSQPEKASGVLGLLVAAINARRESGTVPFTVLSCDNLPANGKLLRDGVVGFARLAYSDELADWIAEQVAFPSSMVDRITPASSPDTYQEAERMTGCIDKAAIETEPFIQWIVEDNFPSGRPKWEAGGATFVADVEPYESMKLTMLNGCHSMLAYSGYLTGKSCVRDVMNDEALRFLVSRHFNAAASLLNPLPGIDYNEYAQALADRFANPAIAHQTFQIASDGTQKLPQRIFNPALEALHQSQSVRPFAFATAMWMRFAIARMDDGTPYEIKDPRAAEVFNAVSGKGQDAGLLSDAFHRMTNFIPNELSLNDAWRQAIVDVLSTALHDGCTAAVKREATRAV